MEYCPNGSLWSTVAQHPIPAHLVRLYTAQILLAVQYLHQHGLVHRDLKSDNILLDATSNCKICDFGSVAKIKNGGNTVAGELNDIVGTIFYLAPEVIQRQNKGGYGRRADIWSLGCIVHDMLTGMRPYADK